MVLKQNDFSGQSVRYNSARAVSTNRNRVCKRQLRVSRLKGSSGTANIVLWMTEPVEFYQKAATSTAAFLALKWLPMQSTGNRGRLGFAKHLLISLIYLVLELSHARIRSGYELLLESLGTICQ